MADIEQINRQALADIAAASTPEALEALRVSLLGKQGSVTALLKGLGALPPAERKEAGAGINRVRDALGKALGERRQVLEDAALEARLASETIDVTLLAWDVAVNMRFLVAVLFTVAAVMQFVGLALIYDLDRKTLAKMNEDLTKHKA